MSIHQKIRDFRRAKGWTEQQFADACDVSRSTIRLWELDGGTAPNRKKQPDVARVMGITVAELMSDGAGAVHLGSSGAVNASPALGVEVIAQALAAMPDVQRKAIAGLLGQYLSDPQANAALLPAIKTLMPHDPSV